MCTRFATYTTCSVSAQNETTEFAKCYTQMRNSRYCPTVGEWLQHLLELYSYHQYNLDHSGRQTIHPNPHVSPMQTQTWIKSRKHINTKKLILNTSKECCLLEPNTNCQKIHTWRIKSVSSCTKGTSWNTFRIAFVSMQTSETPCCLEKVTGRLHCPKQTSTVAWSATLEKNTSDSIPSTRLYSPTR